MRTTTGTLGLRQLLLIDQDPAFAHLLGNVLGAGYRLAHVSAAREALPLLQRGEVDVALLNCGAGRAAEGRGGCDYFDLTAHLRPAPPVIAFGWDDGPATAARMIQAGADDYFAQPLAIPELRFAIERACQRRALASELEAAQRRAPRESMAGPGAIAGLLGTSVPMRRAGELVCKVAGVDTTVLLTGESGTGKEVAARAIHALSARAARPFVGVAACALPESLIEDELFGHQKGAFTGAAGARVGRFEEAQGGTLFLDEIGDLPLPLQAKLLRVLQERQMQRVGSNAQIPLDIRVVCATHRNLEEMVRAGAFRQDLYFRISVVRIEMPALRLRAHDIPLLAGHFLRGFAATHGRPVESMTPAYLAALCAYAWPGNVRELQNVVERSVVLANQACLDLADLPGELSASGAAEAERADRVLADGRACFQDAVRNFKREMVRSALRLNHNNKLRAAQDLHISRPYLHRLMNQLAIEGEAAELVEMPAMAEARAGAVRKPSGTGRGEGGASWACS